MGRIPVIETLQSLGVKVVDRGCFDEAPVDFPDVAQEVCDYVISGRADRAVLICGTGIGMAIAANKVPGIRATVCYDGYSARQAVEHNDVNVLCLGSLISGPAIARDIVTAFLTSNLSPEEKFSRRIRKICDMEHGLVKGREISKTSHLDVLPTEVVDSG